MNNNLNFGILDGKTELKKYTKKLDELSPEAKRAAMAVLSALQIQNYQYKAAVTPYSEVDTTHQTRSDTDECRFQIAGCETAQCGFECCHVEPGNQNTIIMPGLELPVLSDTSVDSDHLSVARMYGDTDSACVACDSECGGCSPRENGESGYKPRDCSYYPWLPETLAKADTAIASIGMQVRNNVDKKCPLYPHELLRHMAVVLEDFKGVLAADPKNIESYLDAGSEMSGYKPFDAVTELESLTPDDLVKIVQAGNAIEMDNETQRLTSADMSDLIPVSTGAYKQRQQEQLVDFERIVLEGNGIQYSQLQYNRQ